MSCPELTRVDPELTWGQVNNELTPASPSKGTRRVRSTQNGRGEERTDALRASRAENSRQTSSPQPVALTQALPYFILPSAVSPHHEGAAPMPDPTPYANTSGPIKLMPAPTAEEAIENEAPSPCACRTTLTRVADKCLVALRDHRITTRAEVAALIGEKRTITFAWMRECVRAGLIVPPAKRRRFTLTERGAARVAGMPMLIESRLPMPRKFPVGLNPKVTA